MSLYIWTQQSKTPYVGTQAVTAMYVWTQKVWNQPLGWTLNPSDKNANITLTGWNLTAQNTWGNVNACVRWTQAISSWKWYWEITIVPFSWAHGIITVWVGTSAMQMPNGNVVGSDSAGWGWWATSALKIHGNITSWYGSTVNTSDVIGVALDMDAWEITMYKNGVSQGLMYTGITWTVYPAVSCNQLDKVTFNFWATSYVYSPPAWYY